MNNATCYNYAPYTTLPNAHNIPQTKGYSDELHEGISFALLTEIPGAVYRFTVDLIFYAALGSMLQSYKIGYQQPTPTHSISKLALGTIFAIAKSTYVGFGKQICHDLDFDPASCSNFEYFLGASGSIGRKIVRASLEKDTLSTFDLLNEGVNGLFYIADTNMKHITEIELLSGSSALGRAIWKKEITHPNTPDHIYSTLVIAEILKTFAEAVTTQKINDYIYLPLNTQLVNILSLKAFTNEPNTQASLADNIAVNHNESSSGIIEEMDWRINGNGTDDAYCYRRSLLEELETILIHQSRCPLDEQKDTAYCHRRSLLEEMDNLLFLQHSCLSLDHHEIFTNEAYIALTQASFDASNSYSLSF